MLITNLDLTFMYVTDVIDIDFIKTYISENTNIPYDHILLFQKNRHKFIEFYEEILPNKTLYFMYNDKKFSKVVLQSLVDRDRNRIEEKEEKCIIM